MGVAVSAGGSVAVSGSSDGTVRVWDLRTGEPRATLEGHEGVIYGVAVSADGSVAVSGSADGTVRVWDLNSLVCLARLEGHTGDVESVAVTPDGSLALSGSDDSTVRVWNLKALRTAPTDKAPPLYLTSKVVLVGDSGVGKSGLAWRLVDGKFHETHSTHGQQFWVLDSLKHTLPNGTQCEAILWDLAGQRNYRLTHALFLDDAELAIVLLNSVDDNEPFKGVDYWLRKLSHGPNREGRPCKVVLVAPRCDVSQPRYGPQQLAEFCQPLGIEPHCIKTSAKTGEGIEELVARIRELLPWAEMVPTGTTATFKRLKEFVLKLKQNVRRKNVLLDWPGLRKLLQKADKTWKFEDGEMMTAVGHLQRHGYVRVLRPAGGEERVLLQPEVLNNLAASFVLQAINNPRGLGALDEGKVRRNEYDFPELRKLPITDRDVLLDTTTELFVERNLAFREGHSDTTYLIFPELINQKKPLLADDQTEEGASYSVTGAVEHVYAAQVVLLGYTNVLTRTHQFQDRAEYETDDGQVCGFRKAADAEGELELVLFFALVDGHGRVD